MDNKSLNIAVVGAGVVGMTTARMLQNEIRNANITIIADGFKGDTTSAVAAGIFRPGTSFRGSTQEITKKWITNSWDYWLELLKSSEGAQAGLMALSSYIFSKDNYSVTRNHLMEGLVPIYRSADFNELKMWGGDWKYGSFFTTFLVDCTRHLPWAEQMFTANGGRTIKYRIDSFSSLPEKYDLVFNCTGLGAKWLCNDHDLSPMRGQIIKVKAPWLKMAVYGDYDTYIIPGFDGIATLGGVRQYDSYNLNVCKHDAAAIYERCCDMLPALKQADVLGHKVGLRPFRVPVRVEPEVIRGLKVVHCYGHGGYGVTSAPGTAMDAIKLGIDLLKTNISSKI